MLWPAACQGCGKSGHGSYGGKYWCDSGCAICLRVGSARRRVTAWEADVAAAAA